METMERLEYQHVEGSVNTLLRVLIMRELFVGDKIEVSCQVQNLHKK